MLNFVFTHASHQPEVVAVNLRPGAHMMVGLIVNDARLAQALDCRVCVQVLPDTVYEHFASFSIQRWLNNMVGSAASLKRSISIG